MQMHDPIAAYLDALDEWGRWLVLLHTCDPAAVTEREHRENMVRRCRSNLEMALRHVLIVQGGPRRSPSVRMSAVVVHDPRREPDDEEKK